MAAGPVLLLGETGTGKSLAARVIYERSPRKSGPFISKDLGAIPLALAESELFGHVKGAFTDAKRRREGAFAAADRGFLILEELANASWELQGKLLSAIDTGEITPVGSDQVVKVDVRVMAATNMDLKEMVEAGTFREDLLYRLRAFAIQMPPLRERPEDLEDLVPHLLMRAMPVGAGRLREPEEPLSVGPDALEALREYHWPGNVRQLSMVLARAAAFASSGVIRAEDLRLEEEPKLNLAGERQRMSGAPDALPVRAPALPRSDGAPAVLPSDHPARWTGPDRRFMTWHQGQREHIKAALQVARGNVTRAARILEIPRSTLQSRIKALGVDQPQAESKGRAEELL